MTPHQDETSSSESETVNTRPPGMQPDDLPEEVRLASNARDGDPDDADDESAESATPHVNSYDASGGTSSVQEAHKPAAVSTPAATRFRKFVPSWLGRALTTTDAPDRYVQEPSGDVSVDAEATLQPDLDDADGKPAGSAVASTPVKTGFGLAVGVAIAVIAWLVLAELSQLLTWIALAMFIALGLNPIVRFFESRGWRRWIGVLVVALGMVAFIGGFLSLLIPALITQITELARRAPTILDGVTNHPLVEKLDAQFHVIDKANEEVRAFINSPDTLANVINAGNFVGQFFFGALIVFVLATYFLASMPQLKLFVYSFAPASKRERVAVLSENITRSVGNYVMGQATVAIINACFSFILMTIFGVPYSLLLALCVAMLAFIPLVGGVTAGALVVIVDLFSLSWQSTLLYAILYIVYLQVEAYFISPKIMSRAVKVPGAVVVIAVIAGGALFGVLGALMAIPVAAAAITLIKEVFFRRQDAR